MLYIFLIYVLGLLRRISLYYCYLLSVWSSLDLWNKCFWGSAGLSYTGTGILPYECYHKLSSRYPPRMLSWVSLVWCHYVFYMREVCIVEDANIGKLWITHIYVMRINSLIIRWSNHWLIANFAVHMRMPLHCLFLTLDNPFWRIFYVRDFIFVQVSAYVLLNNLEVWACSIFS